MATTPKTLKAFDATIKMLEERASSPDTTPEFKAEAKKRIARYKAQRTKLESDAMKEFRSRLHRGRIREGDTETRALGQKIKDRTVSYEDIGKHAPGAMKRGMAALEETFGGDNLLTTVKAAMAITILDVLGADKFIVSAVTGLAESGALANIIPTLIGFATANPIAAVCLVAVAYLGVKKLFGPIVKRLQAKLDLKSELSTMDLESGEGEFGETPATLEDTLSDFDTRSGRTPKKDKEESDGAGKGDDDLVDIFEDEAEHEGDGSDKGGKKDEEEPPKDEKPKDKLKRLEKVVDKKAKATRSAYLDWIMSIKVEEKAKEKFDEISRICDEEYSEKHVISDKNIIKFNEVKKRWDETKNKTTNDKNKYNASVDELDEAIDAYVEAKRESYPRLDVAAEKEALWDKCNISGPTVKEALETWLDEKVKPNLKKWSKSFGTFVVDSVKDLYSKGTKLADDFKESAKKRRLARAEEKSKDTFAEKALENFVKKNISPILKDETITPTFTDEEKPLSIDDISRLDEDGFKENIEKNKNLIKTEESTKKDSEQLLANKQDELKNRLRELKTLTIEKDHLVAERSTAEADKVADIDAKITAKDTEISGKVAEINALKEEIKNYAKDVSMKTARLNAFKAQLKAVEQEQNNRKKEARDAGKDPAKATKKEVDEFVDKYKDDRVGVVIDIITKKDADLGKSLREDLKAGVSLDDSEAFKKLSDADKNTLKSVITGKEYAETKKTRQVSDSDEFKAKTFEDKTKAYEEDLALIDTEKKEAGGKKLRLMGEISAEEDKYKALLEEYAKKKGTEDVSGLESKIIRSAQNLTDLKNQLSACETFIEELDVEYGLLDEARVEHSVSAPVITDESISSDHVTFDDDDLYFVFEDEAKKPVSKDDITTRLSGIKENEGIPASEGAYSEFVGAFNSFVKSMKTLSTCHRAEKALRDKALNDSSSSYGKMKAIIRDLKMNSDWNKSDISRKRRDALVKLFDKLLEFADELEKVLEAKTNGKKSVSVYDKLKDVGLNSSKAPTKLTGDLEKDIKLLTETEKS